MPTKPPMTPRRRLYRRLADVADILESAAAARLPPAVAAAIRDAGSGLAEQRKRLRGNPGPETLADVGRWADRFGKAIVAAMRPGIPTAADLERRRRRRHPTAGA